MYIYIYIYNSAHTLARSLHEVARAKKTASRLLFALGWHLMPQKCYFFREIFELKIFFLKRE